MTNRKFVAIVALNLITLVVAVMAIMLSAGAKQGMQRADGLSADMVHSAAPGFNTQLVAIPSKGGDLIPSLAPILRGKTASVVNISTKGKVQVSNSPFFKDPFFDRFFKFNAPQLPLQQQTQSIGSGVIVDAKNGYILTNHHVINNADVIYVTFLDKRRLEAKLIGSDAETDVAVLQVDADNLTAISLGQSGNLEVGDFVVAIGNPFGLGHTVTSGIVSALERSGIGIVDGYESFIQTDASINPGNSGGALINLKGELIGINTAIVSKGGGNVGIGFAIPMDMAYGVMRQLVEFGGVKRGQLGIHIQDVTPDIVESMGLSVTQGAIIAHIVEGSPAEDAGLKVGDVVTAVNGQAVTSASGLKNQLGALRVNDEPKITVIRGGKRKDIRATIGKRMQQASRGQGGIASSDISLLKGAHFKAGASGVLVVAVEAGTAASRAGLREGDIIVSVNQQRVKTPQGLFKAAKSKQKGILINLKRGNTSMFIVIN